VLGDKTLRVAEVCEVEAGGGLLLTGCSPMKVPISAVALELVHDLVVALVCVVASRVLAPAEGLVSLSEGSHDQRPLAAGVVEDTPDL
jgi:hypothetical protein